MSYVSPVVVNRLLLLHRFQSTIMLKTKQITLLLKILLIQTFYAATLKHFLTSRHSLMLSDSGAIKFDTKINRTYIFRLPGLKIWTKISHLYFFLIEYGLGLCVIALCLVIEHALNISSNENCTDLMYILLNILKL